MIAIGVLVALGAACGDDDSESDSPTAVSAVVTTTQLADFVRNVGGERVEVEQLLDSDVDPHDYEPVPSDAENVAESDIVFRAGLDLDEWLDELIDNAGGDAQVVDTSQGVGASPQGAGGEDDPHIWFDPDNVLVIVDNIVAGLTEVDPDGEDDYVASAEAYKDEIRSMDSEIESIFARCEPDELKLVTNHDSLNHLAEHYGLTIVGAVIPSAETTAEPSAEDLAELIRLIEEEDVQAIFSEASVNTDLEEQVADESGATVVADLYTDTLGPSDSPAATYIEMMTHNAETIVDGLECG